MKNILYVFTVISLSVLTLNKSFATQGACSYHGGINCSASQFSTGKVVCNDGWENSSVNYSDSIMCQDKNDSCPAYYPTNTYNSLINTIDEKIVRLENDNTYNSVCNNLEQEENQAKQKIIDSCSSLQAQREKFGYQTGGYQYTSNQNIQSDCGSTQLANISSSYSLMKLKCSQYKSENEEYKLKYNNLRNCIKDEKELLPQKNMFCALRFGEAIYSLNTYSCVCKNGYILNGDKCEDANKYTNDNKMTIAENQQTYSMNTNNTSDNKVLEQPKNTITLKEAIQRRKDIENNKAKNTSTLNEILNEPKKVSTSTPATTSAIMPDTEIKQPIYKKVFNKIKNWFRF